MKRFNLLNQPSRVGAIISLVVAGIFIALFATLAGDIKLGAAIDVLDLLGEATTSAVAMVWFVLLLSSRPKGKVTSLLVIGSACFWLTTWLDLLDEFISYPPTQRVFTWLESLPAPISMLLMTWGLWKWYEEQQAINRQLQQREHFHREHSLIDPATQLYTLRYFLIQLRREAQLQDCGGEPVSLISIDIDAFASFNRRHGVSHGDLVLMQLAQAIEVPLRLTDLVCRHASDQFIVLLPNTPPEQVAIIAREVAKCCADAFDDELTVTTCSVSRHQGESDRALLTRLQLSLESLKRSQQAKLRKSA